MHRGLWLVLLTLPLWLNTGCIALVGEMIDDPMGHKAALREAQREYTNAVRWGEIITAAGFVAPEIREEFLSYEGEFDGIRVTEFDVGKITFGEKDKTAEARVSYHAYSLKAMTEVEFRETQEWERTDSGWVVRPHIDDIIDQVADYRL